MNGYLVPYLRVYAPETSKHVSVESLLDAISYAETDGGRNDCPRFEPSYMPAGESFTIQGRIVKGTGTNWNPTVSSRWQQYGLASSASYGPWQILAHTAMDRGWRGHPAWLWLADVSIEFVCKHLDHLTIHGRCRTVRDFADAWNTGNAHDAILAGRYVEKVVSAYGAVEVEREHQRAT